MKLLIKIIVTVFTMINTSFLYAEIVNKIEITGNSRVSDETVKVYGGINDAKKEYTKNDLDLILKNIYDTSFFENVSVEINSQTLIINLKEYPVINQLILLGEKSNKIKEQIKKIITLKEKNSFIQSNLNDDINIIRNFYSSIGYNFSEVDAKLRNIDETNLDLVFEIKRGEVTKISKISFLGDKKIKEKRLRDVIASEEDKFWKFISRNTKFSENLVNLDKRLLTNYYKSLGYYDVNITSTSAEISDTGNVNINYTINAGIRYSINKIKTNVDTVFDKELFYPLNKTYNKYLGEYYSPF